MKDWFWYAVLALGFGVLFESYMRSKRKEKEKDDPEAAKSIGRWVHDDGDDREDKPGDKSGGKGGE